MEAHKAVGTRMAALLPVNHLPATVSIHGKRPVVTGLPYYVSDAVLLIINSRLANC